MKPFKDLALPRVFKPDNTLLIVFKQHIIMPNTKANLNVPLSLPFSRHRTFFPGTGYSYSNSFGERIVSKGDWLLYENRQTLKLKTTVL